MNSLKATAGALAIMMAAGMIADFEVSGTGEEIMVRVWSMDDHPDANLRRHVAALLPRPIDEGHVIVMPANGFAPESAAQM